MPIFIASLLGGLVSAAGSLAGRVLISLGIGFVSYSGVTATLNYLVGLVHTNANSLPSTVLAALGLLQFDVVLGIFVAAATVRLTLNGLASGTVKKMVFR